jgi:hypothetical protein
MKLYSLLYLNDAFVIMCFASCPGVEEMNELWLGPHITDNRFIEAATMSTDGQAFADARSSI